MRYLLIVVGLILASPGALAQPVRNSPVDQVDFGLYSAQNLDCDINENGIRVCDTSRAQHLETTATIEGRIGVRFGVTYRNVESNPVTLREIWVFPPPGLRSPSASEPVERDELAVTLRAGETWWSTWILEEDWEVVPGIWTLEVWDADRLVISQAFSIVEP